MLGYVRVCEKEPNSFIVSRISEVGAFLSFHFSECSARADYFMQYMNIKVIFKGNM
jgi:hypothetical protein